MLALAAIWWASVTEFAVAAMAILGGLLSPLSLLATLGLICLVVGLGLALRWREKRSLGLIVPFVMSLLTAVVLDLANAVLSWTGVAFALFAGAVILVLYVALVARDATRRLPVWLIGIFIFAFAIHSGLLSVLRIVAIT